MYLPGVIHSFGSAMQRKYGEKVHKLAINAAFTCPNRDGSRGTGGCTFCNNVSFSPHARQPVSVMEQIEQGKKVVRKRTGAKKYIAYFQAYTNTYADIARLKELYDQALEDDDVVGLSIGTRPDCVPDPVLVLLAEYQQQGYEVWLELGLQSAFDSTLARVNRGHGFAEYVQAIKRAYRYKVQVCTHLIVGLPGEDAGHNLSSLQQVLQVGTQGLKLHPLHVVKGTQLANQWRRGEYKAMAFNDYIDLATEMVARTPPDVIFHRLTATAAPRLLLAPQWCAYKWRVLNAIHDQLILQTRSQGSSLDYKLKIG
ncbi:MAG TPA: TIGR01212 family radical SAM protein [Acidiferrobacteraceae bacterium]|nr:TIGR01212 family radical SAM protein [Acidiferrobacteraceae bacterium]